MPDEESSSDGGGLHQSCAHEATEMGQGEHLSSAITSHLSCAKQSRPSTNKSCAFELADDTDMLSVHADGSFTEEDEEDDHKFYQ